MNFDEVIAALNKPQINGDELFEAISFAEDGLLEAGREDFQALDIAIRLLDALRREAIKSESTDPVSFLARDCGLFPYIDPSAFRLINRTLIAAHTINLEHKVTLHAKQMEVLLSLLNGDNVILSAPTSFGKSLIVDALIKLKRPTTVIMVVPTIALIDETRRRIARHLPDYHIISYRNQVREAAPRTAYVLTQERLLERQDITEIDLLFVDEFYKLDPTRDDERFEPFECRTLSKHSKS